MSENSANQARRNEVQTAVLLLFFCDLCTLLIKETFCSTSSTRSCRTESNSKYPAEGDTGWQQWKSQSEGMMGVSLLQHPPTLPTGQHTNIFELQAHPPYVWWPNNPLKSLNDSASSKSVCFSLSLFFFSHNYQGEILTRIMGCYDFHTSKTYKSLLPNNAATCYAYV